MLLFILFIFFISEVADLIFVGIYIGIFNTLILIVLGFIIGIRIFVNWLRSVSNIDQSQLNNPREIKKSLGDKVLLLLSSILLMLPGYIGDIVGLILLLAPVREFIADTVIMSFSPLGNSVAGDWIYEQMQKRNYDFADKYSTYMKNDTKENNNKRKNKNKRIIETEFSEINEENDSDIHSK